MPFKIIRNDISKVSADAIVNTANPKPCVGSGTDTAVYEAAGTEALLAERRKIGDIAPGEAISTGAYNLNAKYIIHTVGPVWTDGNHGERDILRACYQNSLALAGKLNCESIAFPLIATGTYGFPKDEALSIALSEIGGFLLTHEMEITLVVFDRKALKLSEDLVGSIDQYIDEHTVQALRDDEYGTSAPSEYQINQRRFRESQNESYRGTFFHDSAASKMEPSDLSGKALEEVLGDPGKSFQQRLFELIDASGMDDVTVYKKANVQRQVFSSIRCKPDYRPKKKTALAFAIALRLDMPTTIDLLSRAGLAFSPSNKFDLIVRYFIDNKIYDIYKINAALFDYGQPILGS